VPPADVPAPPDDFETEIPGTFAQDVVGPVCESGDFLAQARRLPAMKRDELLVKIKELENRVEAANKKPAEKKAASGISSTTIQKADWSEGAPSTADEARCDGSSTIAAPR